MTDQIRDRETHRFTLGEFQQMLDEGILSPYEGVVLRDGVLLVPDGAPATSPSALPNPRHSLAALRIADRVSGLETTLLVPAGQTPPATVGALLDQYLLVEASDDRLLQSASITEDGLLRLRQLADLVYDWDDAGQAPGGWRFGLTVEQDGQPVHPEAPALWEAAFLVNRAVPLADLTIDRSGERFDRNWAGFHARRWSHDPDVFEEFVRRALAEAHGDEAVENLLRLDGPERVRDLVDAVASAVWRAPFENYSRFLPGAPRFKTGDDTLRAIMAGDGGICTEKVPAVKFITDHYGITSEILLGGPDARGPFPARRLRELLDTFDFRFARRHMRYWQHAALVCWLEGEPLLVDATNGNIPYLCRKGPEAWALLSGGSTLGGPVPVRMMAETEEWFYHRTPQDIPQDLLFALEGWLDDADLVQVFDNELGLYLSQRYFVMPLPYRSEPERDRLHRHYRHYCDRAGFRMEVADDWRWDGAVGSAFAAAYPRAAAGVVAARPGLAERYQWWQGPGYELDLAVIERS